MECRGAKAFAGFNNYSNANRKIVMEILPDSPHIVMLNKAFPPWLGGIERHVHDISRALAQRGWRVTVLVCNDARFECRERIHGVNVIRVPTCCNLFSQPIPIRYYSLLRELRPNLVHVHVPYPLGWFSVDYLLNDIPLVCTWHSDIVRQRILKPVFHLFEQRFLRGCDRIIVTSQPLLNSSRALRNHVDKTEIIPLAIPDWDWLPYHSVEEIVRNLKENTPEPRVLFVGRIVGYKGLIYLLRAMKEVSATLLIAGDGPLRSRMELLAQQYGLTDRAHFLGSVTEEMKWALYHSADVFVLPSIGRNEAFGYVLLEAMHAGCPLITTDLPTGVRTVNREGESGLVVMPGNEKDLASALQKILSNKNLKEKLSKGSKQRVEREFSFAETICKTESIYRSLLK